MWPRIATYNVHGGVSLDRRYDPERIARVIGEMGADVIALQELQSRDGKNMLDILQRATGMNCVVATTFRTAFGDFGNGLLTRLTIASEERIDLCVPGREPRNAIDATLDCNGTPLRIICTHLGLRAYERCLQSAQLIDAVKRRPSTPTVLLGDFNDWAWPHLAVRELDDYFGDSSAPGTFPSLCPAFALDRIWISAPSRLLRVQAHGSRMARIASDHLPLVADLELRPPEPPHTK